MGASCDPEALRKWALAALQASINMARVQLLRGSYGPLEALATELIVTQTRQCEQFRHILQSQYATII